MVIPAMKFSSVSRAAKPTAMPAMLSPASTAVTSIPNCAATMMPIRMPDATR